MSAQTYLTPEDVSDLWRPLSGEEMQRTEALIPLVEDCLRQEGIRRGYELDGMVERGTLLEGTVKAVVLDVLVRILRQSSAGEPLAQESQTALGYTWSGTYAIPAGGVANAILRNDLKRLGFLRQTKGMVDLYETPRHPRDAL